jgi:hypothetical protein
MQVAKAADGEGVVSVGESGDEGEACACAHALDGIAVDKGETGGSV